MKKIFLLFPLFALLLSACGKDDPINPEDVLFKHLSDGNGIWTVDKIENWTFDANGNKTLQSVSEPDQQIIFYERSEDINGVVITYNAASVCNPDGSNTTYACEAERDRVIFRPPGDNLNAVYTFTVMENDKRKQKWMMEVDINGMQILYISKCNSCEAYYPNYQENEL